jgi:hypothetical protein
MALSDLSRPHRDPSTPTPSETPPPGRRALVVAVVLGSLLVLPAALVQPGPVHDVGPGTSREQVVAAQEWVAAHPAAFHGTNLMIMVGLFALAWFVRAVGRRANARRQRSSKLITTGSVLSMLGLVAAAVANAVISSVRVGLAQPTLDQQRAADAFLAVSDNWYLSPLFLPYLLLVPVGTLLLMAGLIASRAVPWWAAVLGLGFIAAIPFSPPPTAVGVLAGGLLLAWSLGRRSIGDHPE